MYKHYDSRKAVWESTRPGEPYNADLAKEEERKAIARHFGLHG